LIALGCLEETVISRLDFNWEKKIPQLALQELSYCGGKEGTMAVGR
jgi:hypothetical protein